MRRCNRYGLQFTLNLAYNECAYHFTFIYMCIFYIFRLTFTGYNIVYFAKITVNNFLRQNPRELFRSNDKLVGSFVLPKRNFFNYTVNTRNKIGLFY